MFSRFRPMSNDQILNVLDHQIQIVKYSDLDEYENFESLIYPNDGVIVLYETKINSGHWVLIYFDDDGVVHFFDPYGFEYPNDEFKFIDPRFQDALGMRKNHLYDLIFPYKVYHNDTNYQSPNPNIHSCGLWCCARYILRDLTPSQFKKLFYTFPDRDEAVETFINAYVEI